MLFPDLEEDKPDLLPAQATIPEGIVCPGCKATTFKTFWQTHKNNTRHIRLECGRCRRFIKFLPQGNAPGEPRFRHEPRPADASKPDLAPPPATWQWIGYVRLADGVWRAVALTEDLGRCWDALLHYPARGDLLCCPSRPADQREGPGHGTA